MSTAQESQFKNQRKLTLSPFLTVGDQFDAIQDELEDNFNVNQVETTVITLDWT